MKRTITLRPFALQRLSFGSTRWISPRRRKLAPCSIRHTRRRHVHRVTQLDAAMPFDGEYRRCAKKEEKASTKIGIVGFGTFGRFLGQHLIQAGFEVTATSKTDYSNQCREMGVRFFLDVNDFAEDHPEIVVFCTSIISLETVVLSFPFHRLKRSTLVVDVLSVKEFPKNLLLDKLPAELDILCTHPMFGPDSGKGSWAKLPFMFERVRIGTANERTRRVDTFLDFFEDKGCRMLEMMCEEHDRQTAGSQFITHTVGRILGVMDLEKTDLDTKGFESLLSLIDNTSNDSFDLYYGLFMYNQNATEEIDRLEKAFEMVKRQLFERLHAIARDRLFHPPSSVKSALDIDTIPVEALSKTNDHQQNV